MNTAQLAHEIENGGFLPLFTQLYGDSERILSRQKARCLAAVRKFDRLYPGHSDLRIFSAPGRTEIGGNHTDHQQGCVLAAAVDLDVIGVVAFHDQGVIRVTSEGYEPFCVSLDDLAVREGRKDSSDIVRGIAARFTGMGVSISGFDLYSASDVLSGSGISSSAAFETLIGTIIDRKYNDGRAGAVEIAKAGQYAENVYFGKNSGLMDQMVSSVGGLVFIDFADPIQPAIEDFHFDFEAAGYCLLITDTKGSHAGLSADYDAVRSDMECVAAQFGCSCLRQVDQKQFYNELPTIRSVCSDRAILRAAHFFDENRRAAEEAKALKSGDIRRFLELVDQSGRSSENLLQNLYSTSYPTSQAIPLGIMISRRVLGGKGAVRVHGGGFAGTIQAFVPLDLAKEYTAKLERIYGTGACHRLRIRPLGGAEITGG